MAKKKIVSSDSGPSVPSKRTRASHDTQSLNDDQQGGLSTENSTDDSPRDEESIGSQESKSSDKLQTEARRKKRHNMADPSTTSKSDDDDASIALSAPEYVKSIDLSRYQFKTHYSVHGSFTARVSVRSPLGGKAFIEFRELLKDQGIEDDFKKSCFGHFSDLPIKKFDFPSKIVQGLLINRIHCKKKFEVWFNVNGMPVQFGLKEFALMTGLQCHLPPSKEKLDKGREKGESLWGLLCKGKKRIDGQYLICKIKSNDLTKHDKVSLALVWFVHRIL